VAAVNEQKKVTSGEDDAARKRQSHAANAAAVPADDLAAALLEQNKVARREANAARRCRSRVADATATLKCVWSVARCVMCVVQAPAHVLCLLGPEMSGGPSLRCQYDKYII